MFAWHLFFVCLQLRNPGPQRRIFMQYPLNSLVSGPVAPFILAGHQCLFGYIIDNSNYSILSFCHNLTSISISVPNIYNLSRKITGTAVPVVCAAAPDVTFNAKFLEMS